jgi:hypothetical protein
MINKTRGLILRREGCSTRVAPMSASGNLQTSGPHRFDARSWSNSGRLEVDKSALPLGITTFVAALALTLVAKSRHSRSGSAGSATLSIASGFVRTA